jgi:pimeloyl-ACP methyl ester carboxylesterase
MASFVLVHGGAHGAWCWQRLIPLLQAHPRVERVLALDLVGHGARRSEKPLESIELEDYIEDVASAVELQDLRDVVLVGHSLAGVYLPQAAARVRPRVRRLVLVSASVPPEGQSLADLLRHPRGPRLSQTGGTPEDFRRMFCSDLDAADSTWLLSQLGPEPPGPLSEPVSRKSVPPSLPITYIVLTRDQALDPGFQREQARNVDAREILELEAGHSAMVSAPRELARLLLLHI